MTILNAKASGLTRINLRSVTQRRNFIEENLCGVYGWMTAVLFILSYKLQPDTKGRPILSTTLQPVQEILLSKRFALVNKRNGVLLQ